MEDVQVCEYIISQTPVEKLITPLSRSTDVSCVCTNTTFQKAAQSCLTSKCSSADQAAALQLQQSECANGNSKCPTFFHASMRLISLFFSVASSSKGSGSSSATSPASSSTSAAASSTASKSAARAKVNFESGGLVAGVLAIAGAVAGAGLVL